MRRSPYITIPIISSLVLLLPIVSFAAPIQEKPHLIMKKMEQNKPALEDKVNINPEQSNEGLPATTNPVSGNKQVAQSKKVESNEVEAKAYLLRDYYSGAVLEEKAANESRPPASMTKMMTAFVILDQIQAGKLTWDDEVTVSKRASDINEAQIYLLPNEKISLKELFTALMVQSANDAAVALAEYVGGTEDDFVKLMNQKAKKLGLKKTSFVNVTGLDQKDYPDPPNSGAGGNLMSASDAVKLARTLLQDHREILQFTSIVHYTFHQGTSREQKVDNWNKMLPGLKYEYLGVDGMKTGHTNAAGYCFTGTIKKDDIRLVSVVMGTASEAKRFTETAKLYDHVFQNYQSKKFVDRGKAVPGHRTMTVRNADEEQVPVVVDKMIWLPIHKGEDRNYTYQITWNKHLLAPLKKGTVIGQVELLYKKNKIPSYQPIPIITKQNVDKANKVKLFFRDILAG